MYGPPEEDREGPRTPYRGSAATDDEVMGLDGRLTIALAGATEDKDLLNDDCFHLKRKGRSSPDTDTAKVTKRCSQARRGQEFPVRCVGKRTRNCASVRLG